MFLITSIVTLMVLTGINLFITRSLMHPAVVQSGIWAIQLIGLSIFRDRFIEPAEEAIFIVVFGAVMFTIGTHFSKSYVFSHDFIIRPRIIRRSHNLFLILAILVTVCLYIQYEIFTKLTGGIGIASGLSVIKRLISLNDYEEPYGLWKYGNNLATCAMMMLYIIIVRDKSRVIYKILFVYFFVIAFCFGVLSTGRGAVAHNFMLIGLIYILSIEKRKIPSRLVTALVVVCAITFAIFWIMGMVMGKAGDTVSAAIADLVHYQFSPIPALSTYINNNQIQLFGTDLGTNSLRFFYSVGASIGLVNKPASLVQEFVNVPLPTNIYTIYFFYLKDFGIVGAITMLTFLGFFHGGLFNLAFKNKNNEFVFFLLILSYLPLLQSVGGETYLSLLSFWIQFVCIAWILTTANR